MTGADITDEGRAVLESQAQEWIVRLTSGRATTEDAEAFKRWCAQSTAHAKAIADMTRVWDLSRPAGEALSRHSRSSDAPVRMPLMGGVRLSRRALLGGALAASAAYLIVRPPLQMWPTLSMAAADLRTATGEQRQVKLSDSVVIDMNTQTSINLHRLAETNIQGLELIAGEAQISLNSQPATPFVVRADDGRLTASTVSRFNVRATGQNVCVTCLSGAIRAEYLGDTAAASAGQQITYGDGRIAVTSGINPALVVAWRDKLLIFDNEPLARVVEEINRYRPGKLIVTNPQLGARKVQAQLRVDQLDDVVNLVRDGYGAHVTKLPAGIVLLS